MLNFNSVFIIKTYSKMIAALKKKTQLIYQISVLKFQPIYVKKIYNHCYNDLNNINMEAEYILKMF